MAVKNLTLNEMVQITATMLHPEGSPRARLEANPMLTALVPALETAHHAVLGVMPRPEDPRLQELSAQAAAADAVHDALVGSIHGLLTATADLLDDGATYLKLRDQLLPEGIAGAARLTYEGQAGYAKRLRAHLTEAQRTQLSSLAVGNRNLLELVTQWMDAGERIGELDQERQRIASEAQAPTASTVSQARYRWIRVVNAVRDVADIAELTDADRTTIFGALAELEGAADLRAARRRAGKVEQDVAAELEASAQGAPAR